MPANPIVRRLLSVTTMTGLFLVVTVLSPLLFVAAGLIDVARRMTGAGPVVAVRVLAFMWVYLLGELWALLALLVTAPLPRGPKVALTYRLQDKWVGWNLYALTRIFALEISVEGQETASPGPVVILSRHASIVDTLLPALLVARPTGLRLRYVLKDELLADPALDIAGNRLPNVFIDRTSRDASVRTQIRDLASGLGPRDGVLIYPEGTRFSAEKLKRIQARSGTASRFQNVLPPKPGGTLALLDATDADVVVLAHRGLEGLATIPDIWRGSLVGSTISVRLWRIPRTKIPLPRTDRVGWLSGVWADVDEWVSTEHSEGR